MYTINSQQFFFIISPFLWLLLHYKHKTRDKNIDKTRDKTKEEGKPSRLLNKSIKSNNYAVYANYICSTENCYSCEDTY